MVLKNPSEYDKGKTILLLIRHAERIKIPGTPEPHDFSLSKKGILQAKSLAKKLSKMKGEIDILYSSSMKRAKETAEIVGKSIGKKVNVLPKFEEVSRLLEGKKYYKVDYWKAIKKLRETQKIFDNMLIKNKGKLIVLVAHGRLNKMLIGKKMGISYSKTKIFHFTNCFISLLRFNGKELEKIYSWNSSDFKREK